MGHEEGVTGTHKLTQSLSAFLRRPGVHPGRQQVRVVVPGGGGAVVGHPAGLHGAAQPAAGAATHLLRLCERLRDAAGELPTAAVVDLHSFHWHNRAPLLRLRPPPVPLLLHSCCRQQCKGVTVSPLTESHRELARAPFDCTKCSWVTRTAAGQHTLHSHVMTPRLLLYR